MHAAALTDAGPASRPSLARRNGFLLLAILAVAMGAAQSPAQATVRTQVIPGFDGQVHAVSGPDSNGVTYVGGSFSKFDVFASGASALVDNSTAALNSAFPKVSGGGGTVEAAAPDGSGGYYIGGSFTTVDGTTRNRAAHIKSDGSLDANWNPNVSGAVYAIAVSGSSVYLGGSFTGANSINGSTTRNCAAKVDTTNGTVDSSWNPNVNGRVSTIAVDGSNVYLGGLFNAANSINGNITRNYAAKVDTTNGTVNGTWNPNLNSSVTTIAVSGSSVYLGGSFSGANSINGNVTRNYAAKVDTTNGTVDGTWNPNVSGGYVKTISVLGSNVYLGGTFYGANSINGNTTRNYAAKVDTTNGTVDGTWNPNVNETVYVIMASGSNVYLGGSFTQAGGFIRNNAAAFDSTGQLTSWNPNVGNSPLLIASMSAVYAIAVSGSSVYLGGRFNGATAINGNVTRNYAAKVDTTNGTVDSSWNPNVGGTVPGFGPGDPISVRAIAVSGSSVFLGGTFNGANSINGTTTRNYAAKVDTTNGTVDGTWNPNPNGKVNSIAVSGPNAFLGGQFNFQLGDTSVKNAAKVDMTSGTVDSSWDPNPNSRLNAIAIDGSNVYLGGSFRSLGGTYDNSFALTGDIKRNYAAKVDTTNGTVDGSWNPNLNNNVNGISVDEGHVYLGGSFSGANSVNGTTTRNYAAAVDKTNGTVDGTWNPNPNPASGSFLFGAGVYAIGVSGSNVFVGGALTVGNVITAVAPPTVASPSITDGPAEGSLSKLNSASFTFSSATSGAAYQCQLDQQTPESCTSPKSYSSLSDGEHAFKVYATKSAYNDSGTVTRTWTVDTTSPAAPALSGAPSSMTNQSGASIGLSGEASATFTCSVDGGSYGACGSSPKVLSSLADGVHSLAVKQTDLAGNTSIAATSSWTVDTTAPTTPSAFTGIPTSPTGSTTATIGFTLGEANGTVECKLDTGSWSACTNVSGTS
ncbi:MAG: hypothetical protein NTX07_07930, partial [Solirubrobacterales bacterium]|nr:hypothetical protein [Solirubrobacterales bacterium]